LELLKQLEFGYLCFTFAPFRAVFGYFRFEKFANPGYLDALQTLGSS